MFSNEHCHYKRPRYLLITIHSKGVAAARVCCNKHGLDQKLANFDRSLSCWTTFNKRTVRHVGTNVVNNGTVYFFFFL